MPELDFETLRRDLRDRIEAPGYSAVRTRSRAIRRRRSWTAAGAGLACLAVLGTGTLLAAQRPAGDADQVAASPDALPAGSVWRAGPVTVLGLNGPVLDVPGEVRDVQFGDADHGYALLAACPPQSDEACVLAMAASADGGRTWRAWTPPIAKVAADRLPRLITVDATGVVVSAGDSAWYARYGESGWRDVQTSAGPAQTIGDGRLGVAGASIASRNSAGCVNQPIQVWRRDGTVAFLANQPNLGTCWTAAEAAPDGAWWVGGIAGSAPAVAVTRDSGRTWDVSTLPGPAGSWAQVSRLGSDIYATVVSARSGDNPETRTIQGVYRSAAGGAFVRFADQPGTLVGDVVPLLDGRLLTAGPNWYVTAQQGTGLAVVGNELPFVYRLQATPGGWVALDLFDNGWTAVSHDGATWQKINVH